MALSLARAPAVAAASSSFGAGRPALPVMAMSPRLRRAARGGGVVAQADLLGDLGARDPFPEEIASNFGEKTLGDVDTLHRILIPTLSALSLARLPVDPSPAPLAAGDARKLLLKVVGWRLLHADGDGDAGDGSNGMRLQCVWKVRDEACGHELVARIAAALDGAGHAPPVLLFEPPNQVRAELYSPSIGGLSMNDFIVAARIDKVKTLDLIPKKRVWA